MNLGNWFKSFNLEKIRLSPTGAEFEIAFKPADRDAAWELYVEMLTRTMTQPLSSGEGVEEAALDSVYSLFPTTRKILRHHGRSTIQFTKVAVPVLNQLVRPFTTKWHRISVNGGLSDEATRKEFRSELAELQQDLRKYNRMLADIAGVEDLTTFEAVE